MAEGTQWNLALIRAKHRKSAQGELGPQNTLVAAVTFIFYGVLSS